MTSTRNMLMTACVTAAVLFAPVPGGARNASAAETSTVATLAGSWGGTGRISYTDGTSEGIRCNAYYSASGNQLTMAIQCKSDSNALHVRSKLRIDGSRVSGDWEERTFNANGNGSGRVSGNSMSLNLTGGGFNGSMSVNYSKASHSVTIATQGIAMSRATMTFTRR
jgi:hypothetical protein